MIISSYHNVNERNVNLTFFPSTDLKGYLELNTVFSSLAQLLLHFRMFLDEVGDRAAGGTRPCPR